MGMTGSIHQSKNFQMIDAKITTKVILKSCVSKLTCTDTAVGFG